MLKTLLASSAVALAVALPTTLSAQETQTEDATSPVLDVAPETGQPDVDTSPVENDGTSTAPYGESEPNDAGTPIQESSDGSQIGTASVAGAVIPEEEAGGLRADEVIGMKVVDSGGDQIGKVTDIILNGEGQMTGLVISSGGFLGIGAKKVGIKVEEADIDVESEIVVANLSEEDLEEAPKFKTQDDIKSEREALQRRQEMERQQQQPPAAGTN